MKQIGKYKIQDKLGFGGMGTVWLAKDTQINRLVAIKSLHPQFHSEEDITSRFKKEWEQLAKLKHSGIIDVYDYIENETHICGIMEYAQGMNLKEYIKTISGPIPEAKLIHLFTQLLDIFEYVHSQKIIHRDIKPANIIINPKDEIKIVDFGIAKDNNTTSHTITGTQMGSPGYMSPEQIKGKKVSKSTDIYSLGVTLFQMSTGTPVYDSSESAPLVASRIINDTLPDASTIYPGVTEKINNIIQKATEKNEKNRFQSCAEFKKAFQKEVEIHHQKTSKSKKIKKKNSNNYKKNLSLFIVLSLICIILYFCFSYSSTDMEIVKTNETTIRLNTEPIVIDEPIAIPSACKCAKNAMKAGMAEFNQSIQTKCEEYAATLTQEKRMKRAMKALECINSNKSTTTNEEEDSLSIKKIPTRFKNMIKTLSTPEKTNFLTKSSSFKFINFGGKVWDFGTIQQGDTPEFTFTFKNTGNQPMIISNAKSSCGCLIPQWPKNPIPPGEKGEINVKFNSENKKGAQNKTVTLTANTTPPTTKLRVTGIIKK